MRRILYWLNTIVLLIPYLIGIFCYGIAKVCDFIMDKIDFRLKIKNENEL